MLVQGSWEDALLPNTEGYNIRFSSYGTKGNIKYHGACSTGARFNQKGLKHATTHVRLMEDLVLLSN